MADVITFPRQGYVDRAAIESACAALDLEADKIARASIEAHGACDVLAHELCAYASAIRRALGTDQIGGGNG